MSLTCGQGAFQNPAIVSKVQSHPACSVDGFEQGLFSKFSPSKNCVAWMTALHAFCRELDRCNWNFKTGINWRTNKSWIHNVQCRTVSHCTISHCKVYVCLHHICIRYLIKPSKHHCPKYADEFTPTLPTSILLSRPIFTRKSPKKQPQSSPPSSMTRLCKALISVAKPGARRRSCTLATSAFGRPGGMFHCDLFVMPGCHRLTLPAFSVLSH